MQFKVLDTESFPAQTVTVSLRGLFVSSKKQHKKHSVPTCTLQTLAWIWYITHRNTMLTQKLEVILKPSSAESTISQRAITTSNTVKDI